MQLYRKPLTMTYKLYSTFLGYRVATIQSLPKIRYPYKARASGRLMRREGRDSQASFPSSYQHLLLCNMATRAERKHQLFDYLKDPWKPATSDTDFRIRLLELYPTNQKATSDPLRCRLYWTPLVTNQSFNALSYTWGVDPPTSKIHVGDEYLPITPSLETALEHIRHEQDTITIWIDQISINQSDAAEKTEQVSNMDRIYRAATKVIVWLGPAANGSDEFMEVWSEVGKMVADFNLYSYMAHEKLALLGRIIANIDPQDPATKQFQSIVNHAARLLDEKMLRAIAAWERRPWFTRVWVVQEYALGRDTVFMCGHKTVSAELAQFARLIFEEAKDRIDPALHSLCIPLQDDPMHTFFATKELQRKVITGNDKGHPLYRLLKLMYVGKNMQATNACDKIFAILGLATDAKALGLQADYSIANRVDLIFARTTRALLGEGEILAMAQTPRDYQGLPSWVPDFTGRIEESFADMPLADNFDLFSASRGLDGWPLHEPDELVLGLAGCVVDVIEELGEIWDGNKDYYEYENNAGIATKLHLETMDPMPEVDAAAKPRYKIQGIHYHSYGYLEYLRSTRSFIQKSARKNRPIYPTEKRRAEACWRLPVGDVELDEGYNKVRASEASTSAHSLYVAAFEFLSSWETLPEHELRSAIAIWERDEATRLPGRYRNRMRCMKNKRPYITKEGYVGMGPIGMEEGDLVVVLGSAFLPYVVRRIEAYTNGYSLIGECYCDGVMDGEIVSQRTEQEFYFV